MENHSSHALKVKGLFLSLLLPWQITARCPFIFSIWVVSPPLLADAGKRHGNTRHDCLFGVFRIHVKNWYLPLFQRSQGKSEYRVSRNHLWPDESPWPAAERNLHSSSLTGEYCETGSAPSGGIMIPNCHRYAQMFPCIGGKPRDGPAILTIRCVVDDR